MATEKRESQRKRDLEKSASQTRSIIEIVSAQFNKNNSDRTNPTPSSLLSFPAPKSLQKRGLKKGETEAELRTQVVKDLEELLRRKTEQINKHGHILAPKSNYYRRHQMVQSFLWMSLNKEKNIIRLDRQGLALIVAQSFNRQTYTRRKFVKWGRSWVKYRVIPSRLGVVKRN